MSSLKKLKLGCLVITIGAVSFMLFLAWLGSQESVVWSNAERADTIESLRRFIDKFPDGTNVVTARKRIEELERQARHPQAAKGEGPDLSIFKDQEDPLVPPPPRGGHDNPARNHLARLKELGPNGDIEERKAQLRAIHKLAIEDRGETAFSTILAELLNSSALKLRLAFMQDSTVTGDLGGKDEEFLAITRNAWMRTFRDQLQCEVDRIVWISDGLPWYLTHDGAVIPIYYEVKPSGFYRSSDPRLKASASGVRVLSGPAAYSHYHNSSAVLGATPPSEIVKKVFVLAPSDEALDRHIWEIVKRRYEARLRYEVAFLNDIGDPTVWDPFIASALHDMQSGSHDRIREAGWALQTRLRPRAMPQLVAALLDEGFEHKTSLIELVGARSEPYYVDALMELLDDEHFDEPSLTAKAAAEMLGKIGDPRAVRALQKLVKRTDLYKAKEALRRIEEGPSESVASAEANVPLSPADIKAVLANGRDRRRLLHKPPDFDKACLDELAEALDDPASDVQQVAAELLAGAGDPRPTDFLASLLGDADRERRLRAAISLAALGDTRAVPVLLAALKEGHHRFRHGYRDYDVRPALARLGRPAAEQLLQLADTDEAGAMQSRIRSVLESVSDPNAVAVLVAALQKADDELHPSVRTALSKCLSASEDLEQAAPLLNAMKERDHPLASTAVAVLSQVPSPNCMASVVTAVQRDPRLLMAVTPRDLGRLAHHGLVDTLLAALGNDAPEVRTRAVNGLSHSGILAAKSALQKLATEDLDVEVRYDAERAVGHIGSVPE